MASSPEEEAIDLSLVPGVSLELKVTWGHQSSRAGTFEITGPAAQLGHLDRMAQAAGIEDLTGSVGVARRRTRASFFVGGARRAAQLRLGPARR